MKIQTLFKAYQGAEFNKRYAAEMRGAIFGNGTFGIASADDRQARIWQRYDRLSRRIEARIMGEKICPICTAPNDYHYTNCRHKAID